jgi:DNA-binding beta-propeller fold protein YncE
VNRRLPFALLALSACLRDVPSGPDPGPCAVLPDGPYAWGEIGIGNCLAGPVDLRFISQDDRTWLAITNADPYKSFTSGSLLLVDWDSIDTTVARNLLPSPSGDTDTSVIAAALALDPFLGDVGYLPGRSLAIVPSRYSPQSKTRVGLDDAFVVDLADPLAPSLWSVDAEIALRDDPQPVVVDVEASLAYVGNLTDHSVSVIDWDPTREPLADEVCDPACALALLDVAPQAALVDNGFTDAGWDTLAEIDALRIEDPRQLVTDTWTMTYTDATLRVWAPEAIRDATGADTGALGVVRWTSGGHGTPYAASALGVEFGPIDGISTVEDPLVVLSEGLPEMWYSDAGLIRRTTTAGAAGEWLVDETVSLAGSPAAPFLGAPSLVVLEGALTLFYDQRAIIDGARGPASIGRTASEDGVSWTLTDPTPVLDVANFPAYSSFEHPFVTADVNTGTWRMFFSGRRVSGEWVVLLSESDDGLTWGEPLEVLASDTYDYAAPVVHYVQGRYLLWVAQGDGTQWQIATAASYDGVDWTPPVAEIATDLTYDAANPPRAAVQFDTSAGWSIDGVDSGLQPVSAFTGGRVGFAGFGLEVASGHALSNSAFADRRSAGGIVVGSVDSRADGDWLYVTAVRDNGRPSLGLLDPTGLTWRETGGDLIPPDVGGNVTGAESPVVWRDGSSRWMWYGARDQDGTATLRAATSPDGLTWTPSGAALLPVTGWDSLGQLPHSVEITGDGGLRLWYAGFDGELWRIGSATAADPAGPWVAEPGAFDAWQFGPGAPGSFDDSGVKDPHVWIDAAGDTHLYYAGFDGTSWHLGHALRAVDGSWERRIDAAGDLSLPAMSGIALTFTHAGVESPVAVPRADGGATVYFAGSDGFERRLGTAFSRPERPAVVFPTPRYATTGDTLSFLSERGGKAVSAIRLDQVVSEFTTDGIGMSAMIPDWERGLLYVLSKLSGFVYVIDIRDDTTLGFDDTNYLDLEALIRVPSVTGTLGFRGGVLSETRDRLYLSARSPDLVFVLDLTRVLDDDRKEVLEAVPIGTMPLRTLGNDEGAPTLSLIGANGMALAQGEDLLLVTEFRNNLVDVYDLSMGAFGTLVAQVPYLGENPHVVRVSPDGRYAVVANYTGEVTENSTSGTIAVIDLDPDSPTYLEAVTWLVNR